MENPIAATFRPFVEKSTKAAEALTAAEAVVAAEVTPEVALEARTQGDGCVLLFLPEPLRKFFPNIHVNTYQIAPAHFTEKSKERFWRKVKPTIATETECWLWKRSKNLAGYGKLSFEGKFFFAHRLSFMLHTGYDPGLLFVCHRCDVSACCNPHHLFAGTHQDNADDATAKGRYKHGEECAASKLTALEVESIREEARKKKVTLRSLADRYGVSRQQVSRIVHGDNWRRVGRPAKGENTPLIVRSVRSAPPEESKSANRGGAKATHLEIGRYVVRLRKLLDQADTVELQVVTGDNIVRRKQLSGFVYDPTKSSSSRQNQLGRYKTRLFKQVAASFGELGFPAKPNKAGLELLYRDMQAVSKDPSGLLTAPVSKSFILPEETK